MTSRRTRNMMAARRLPLTHRGVRTTAAPARARGVSVRVTQGAGRIAIRLAGAARRFKYAGYRALHSPERLVIDLHESAPPAPPAEVRRAPRGCLALDRVAVGPRRVSAAGGERDLFEHNVLVRLRRAGGRVHAQRPGIAAAGRWSIAFRYPRARPQSGTLEAVAVSAKDGTLECLVQVRVRFGS